MHSFIPIHRISFRSWEPIYFLVSRRYLRERPKYVPSSVQQSICSLLAWMMRHVISCFSSTSIYINIRFFVSITRLMTSGAELILSSQKGLVATSCCSQIMPTVQTHQNCTSLCTQECWVSITLMWSIPGLGCRTLRLAPSKCYGCDGMRLLTQKQGLQDGIVRHWTCCASHPYTKTIPLALWIRKLYYVGVISSRHLTRECENPTLTSLALQKIKRTICYTMLAGKFNYFLRVPCWSRPEPQVFRLGSTHAVPFGARSWSPSYAPHFQPELPVNEHGCSRWISSWITTHGRECENPRCWWRWWWWRIR